MRRNINYQTEKKNTWTTKERSINNIRCAQRQQHKYKPKEWLQYIAHKNKSSCCHASNSETRETREIMKVWLVILTFKSCTIYSEWNYDIKIKWADFHSNKLFKFNADQNCMKKKFNNSWISLQGCILQEWQVPFSNPEKSVNFSVLVKILQFQANSVNLIWTFYTDKSGHAWTSIGKSGSPKGFQTFSIGLCIVAAASKKQKSC